MEAAAISASVGVGTWYQKGYAADSLMLWVQRLLLSRHCS